MLARGLATSCITVHAPVCRPNATTVEEQVKRIDCYLGLARQLGCGIVRVIGTTGTSEPAPVMAFRVTWTIHKCNVHCRKPVAEL